jgi:glutathione S-transferase
MCRMSIDFYYISLSTPCRSVMMTTAYMAGVDVNLKLLNLMNGYQLKPESLKISLQHNVPTIVDDGFCLNESQAICAYVINRHSGQKGRHLYPEDATSSHRPASQFRFIPLIHQHQIIKRTENSV